MSEPGNGLKFREKAIPSVAAIASTHQSTTPLIPERLRMIHEHVAQENLEGHKILDVGGVTGYYEIMSALVAPGELYILNIDPASVVGTHNSYVADATNLPFDDGTWDTVLSLDTIEHMMIPDDLIAECYRVLKKNGRFILETPNLADFYSRIAFLFGYSPFWYNPSRSRVGVAFRSPDGCMGGHKSVFTYRGLSQLLREIGFTIEISLGYCYADVLDCDPMFYPRRESMNREIIRGSSLRRGLGKILPKSMKEGLLFVCRK